MGWQLEWDAAQKLRESMSISTSRMDDPLVNRLRSEGPLAAEELEYCRANGIPLAFDPVLIGYVPLLAIDDIAPAVHASRPIRLPGNEERTKGLAGFGDGYALRRWHENDVTDYIRLLDDPSVWRYLPEAYPGRVTHDLARDLLEIANDDAHHLVLAIVWSGTIIGQARLVWEACSNGASEGEISYWFGREHWSQGHASAVLPRFIDQCFERNPALRALTARVHENNPASAKVLRRSGFMPEGNQHGPWQRFRLMRPEEHCLRSCA